MENASKALLIAGAVLLVIAIIAIGMAIFGNARGVVNQAEGQVDNMSVQIHNQQFLKYEGTGKSLSQVKELFSLILANNEKYNSTKSPFRVGCIGRRYTDVNNNGTFTGAQLSSNTIMSYSTAIATFNSKIENFQNSMFNGTYSKFDVKLTYGTTSAYAGIIKTINIYAWCP